MKKRLLALEKNYSLLLFGARGVGKSTLVRNIFPTDKTLYINLLDPAEENRFARNPSELIELVNALPPEITHVIIDEVQKVPKLLDAVHLLIESEQCTQYFILTGSSARKLKAAGVNLLAGRAFVSHLYPFSYLELPDSFVLSEALHYGLLPKVLEFSTAQSKTRFLQAYTLTYLKEEIWAEQLIKKLDPFRRFLEVAAQCNGKLINYSNIARDVGADDKTVKNYFSILEDTLLGKMIEPFQHSFRKRLKTASRFYFFDTGVVRALTHMLDVPLTKKTSYYGELFESFIVMECVKLSSYYHSEFRFSYLMTANDVEVDLVIERPGKPRLLIEIKSTDQVQLNDLRGLQQVATEIGPCEAICFSNDPRKKKLGNVTIYPWQQGIKQFFTRG